MTRILTVALVTLGDPGRLTGGYRYHRRMAELAPACGADVVFVSFPDRPFPLPALAGPAVLRQAKADVLVLDSIAAACLGPWLRRRRGRPVVGSLHQPPGGIGHRPLRRTLQAPLDRWAYRRARLLVVASQALGDEVAAQGYPPRGSGSCPRAATCRPPPATPRSTSAGDAGWACCAWPTGWSTRTSSVSWRPSRDSRTGWSPCTWPVTTTPIPVRRTGQGPAGPARPGRPGRGPRSRAGRAGGGPVPGRRRVRAVQPAGVLRDGLGGGDGRRATGGRLAGRQPAPPCRGRAGGAAGHPWRRRGPEPRPPPAGRGRGPGRRLAAAAGRRAATRPTWAQSADLFFKALREAARPITATVRRSRRSPRGTPTPAPSASRLRTAGVRSAAAGGPTGPGPRR